MDLNKKIIEKLLELKKIYEDLMKTEEFRRDRVGKMMFKKKIEKTIKEIEEIIGEIEKNE